MGLLATPFGHGLRALALTCDDLRSLWSRSNLHASQSKFFTVWPPNPSQRKLSDVINLLLANEIENTCEETYESVWPPNASLYSSSTCLRMRLLAGPFGRGLSHLTFEGRRGERVISVVIRLSCSRNVFSRDVSMLWS